MGEMKLEDNNKLKGYLSFKYDMDIQDITPVKNVMHIYTSSGDRCLKRVKYRKEHFLFIMSAMKHLMNNGFEGLIPLIPARNGEMYVELEDGYGFLTEWISSRECDYSNPIELKMAAVTLSKIHNLSKGYEPPKNCEPRIGWGRWADMFTLRIKDMMEFKKIIESHEELSYFDKLYIDSIDYFINQAETSIENLKSTGYFELMEEESGNKSFCHHDFAHHNVLLSDDLKVYVIDFDYCILDSRLHDLSSLIIRNMRRGNWNMEKAQYIIDCYLRLGSLKSDEIPVMNAFMEFPQDFWQVGLQYYKEKLKWEESHFIKRLSNVIDDETDRRQFLSEFKHSIVL